MNNKPKKTLEQKLAEKEVRYNFSRNGWVYSFIYYKFLLAVKTRTAEEGSWTGGRVSTNDPRGKISWKIEDSETSGRIWFENGIGNIWYCREG